MRLRVFVVVVLLAGLSEFASAQTVQMLFTPGVSDQAIALKDSLKVDKANVVWFGAMALVGAPPARLKAFADKCREFTAVVVLGEDALKAVSEVEFEVPVIVVNATGPTAAKSRVLRVYDRARAAPAGAVDVTSPDAVAGLVRSGKEVALKGDVAPVVQAVLTALK